MARCGAASRAIASYSGGRRVSGRGWRLLFVYQQHLGSASRPRPFPSSGLPPAPLPRTPIRGGGGGRSHPRFLAAPQARAPQPRGRPSPAAAVWSQLPEDFPPIPVTNTAFRGHILPVCPPNSTPFPAGALRSTRNLSQRCHATLMVGLCSRSFHLDLLSLSSPELA